MAAITRTKADARPVNDVLTVEVVCDVAVEAGQTVYIKSNGHAALANGGAAGTMCAIGVATMDCAIGRAVAVVVFGKVTGYSGMTPGAKVYQSNTAGELDTAAGTVPQILGISLSATDVFISPTVV